MGLIFDIQRFALHDGDGIRTVIFFKGCPLRCAWCCNPESQICHPQLLYSKNKCGQCKRCLSECKHNALSIADDVITIDYNRCIVCGDCAKHCARKALHIAGMEYSVEELLEIVLKDRNYYDLSNGGITLSGGEALMQGEFAISLLKECKQHGLNCAVETSGFVDRKILTQSLNYIDCYLVDFKHYNSNIHKLHTGMDNRTVLDTIDFLCNNNAKIILRCPIIPSVNDTMEHFHAIASLSNNYSNIESVEIMPYHNFGTHKYAQLNLVAKKFAESSIGASIYQLWERAIIDSGCTKLKSHV